MLCYVLTKRDSKGRMNNIGILEQILGFQGGMSISHKNDFLSSIKNIIGCGKISTIKESAINSQRSDIIWKN